ncbi:MAG: MBL fold metallo-hydrolase [Anaerolineae bacterium]
MADGPSQRIVVLGTAHALTTAERDNTALFLDSPDGGVLIDCPGSPFHKLLKAGADPLRLRGVVLTHVHVDHIYGLPSLFQELWLAGRTEPLPIYANAHALPVAEQLLGLLGVDQNDPQAVLKTVPEEVGALLLQEAEYSIFTAPVRHVVPTLAVKVVPSLGRKIVVHSSDTLPAPSLVSLARGAQILFHDASHWEENDAHATPEQAAKVAQDAGVEELVVIHYGEEVGRDPEEVRARCARHFEGPIRLAAEMESIRL